MKVAEENDVEIADLDELVEQMYEKDDGTKASMLSRNSVRKALEVSAEI
jgi:hypothetical protein